MSDDSDEIERLRARVTALEAENEAGHKLALSLTKYGAEQKARCLELEAEIAVLRGTLSRYNATEDDQPVIIHDCPPDAPR